jgi:hypothetical protein
MTAPLARLQIELVTTVDDNNGPRPPIGDGWHVARRDGVATLWRRISLRDRYAASGSADLSQGGVQLKGKRKW